MTDPQHAYMGIAALERTALAWTRSALAMAAAGALLIRYGIVTGTEAAGIAGGVPAIGLGLWMWAYGDRLYRRRVEPTATVAEQRRVLRLLALATIVLALLSLALVVGTLPDRPHP